MYIVMITGSPHRHGTSVLLADEFIRGATESGHTIFRHFIITDCLHRSKWQSIGFTGLMTIW